MNLSILPKCLRHGLARKRWTAVIAAGLLAPIGLSAATDKAAPLILTSPDEILRQVRPARPHCGGRIPADFARRLGTAHVSGRYHFTEQPFLIEGAEQVQRLGLGGIKLWFSSLERAYRFNSTWDLPVHSTYADIARHPYFQAAFARPFNIIALELYPAGIRDTKGVGLDLLTPTMNFSDDEAQIYALTKYLLETYRERDVTFLLQNWEGDWMFRGSSRQAWLKGNVPDLDARVDLYVRWFAARQRGVERARAEVTGTRCRVFHAVEVNKVFDALQGLPTLTTHVLPKIRPDYISWSCYDGLKTEARSADKTAIGLWQGLEIIQHYARTVQHDAAGRPAVYIGEIGFPEQVVPPESAVEMMDAALGVFFARHIPYILYWELYCNERKDGTRSLVTASEPAQELRGFWLIKPDGTLGGTGAYFRELLMLAGGKL